MPQLVSYHLPKGLQLFLDIPPLLITNKQTNKKLNSALQSVSCIFTCWNKLEFLDPFVCRGRLKGQNADTYEWTLYLLFDFFKVKSKMKNASFCLIGAWVKVLLTEHRIVLNDVLSWFVDAQLFNIILALLVSLLHSSSPLLSPLSLLYILRDY